MLEFSRYKFDEDGNALAYYGNTIVSFLNQQESDIYKAALYAQQVLKDSEISRCLSFLPPASFHMTVLTLCRDIDRNGEYWPKDIQMDEMFSVVDALLKEKVEQIPKPKNVMMEVEECLDSKIVLRPHRREDEEKLCSYRDLIADITGIRHEWHETFKFHITLDYRVKEYGEVQKSIKDHICSKLTKVLKENVQPFEIHEPEFVIFNDMLSYETDLSKRGNLY